MPTSVQSSLNPNDLQVGGYGQKKKQFVNVNQHYISHNAVIPPYDMPQVMSAMERNNSPSKMGSPYRDPYSKIPLKPNQTDSMASREAYQMNMGTAAGVSNFQGARLN